MAGSTHSAAVDVIVRQITGGWDGDTQDLAERLRHTAQQLHARGHRRLQGWRRGQADRWRPRGLSLDRLPENGPLADFTAPFAPNLPDDVRSSDVALWLDYLARVVSGAVDAGFDVRCRKASLRFTRAAVPFAAEQIMNVRLPVTEEASRALQAAHDQGVDRLLPVMAYNPDTIARDDHAHGVAAYAQQEFLAMLPRSVAGVIYGTLRDNGSIELCAAGMTLNGRSGSGSSWLALVPLTVVEQWTWRIP